MKLEQGTGLAQDRSIATNGTSISIIRDLSLRQIKFIFEGCTTEELEYFYNRAIEQEEYELCKHLHKILSGNLLDKIR